MAVEPDHIYVIPPNTDMAISDGVLGLKPRTEARGHHMPVDHFFYSLAEDQKENAIGVILSGTASDGALGLRAIKAEGGITFAQDEKSAKYGGMPHSAVVAGAVDLVLPPEGIAKELVRISRHPHPRAYLPGRAVREAKTAEAEDSSPKNGNDLGKVLTLLESSSGVNFKYYKPSTLKRRILRRMAICKMKDMKNYSKHLQENPAELQALYQDVLINVTGFFRDPETFEALNVKVFPEITKNREPQAPIRIWVPGCSTGEEGYSIAISLIEFLGKKATNIPIQIFATDLSNEAIISTLRRYLEDIAKSLSPGTSGTLRQDGWRLSGEQTIQEMCVFARHDLTRTPFLESRPHHCRNVLIYRGPFCKQPGFFHYSQTDFPHGSRRRSAGSGSLCSVDRKYEIIPRSSVNPATSTFRCDAFKRPISADETVAGLITERG
jgi:two-component system CheB/CheR fusion protein